jgi:hypothetical protein
MQSNGRTGHGSFSVFAVDDPSTAADADPAAPALELLVVGAAAVAAVGVAAADEEAEAERARFLTFFWNTR